MISIVVPTYRRPEALARCLRALMALHPPPGGHEAHIVDDGGDIDLAPLITAADPAGHTLRLVRQTNAGPAAARNAGAARARGALLAFTDDDCRPEPHWLVALAAAHADHPGRLLGGHTWNERPDSVPAQASQDLLAFLYRDQQRRPYDAPFFASNNLAVPAARFHALGGFDVTFPLAAGEDRAFCDRYHHTFSGSDGGLHHVPHAVVRHAHVMTVKQFWRQHHNYGRGALHFQNARARFNRPGLTPEGPGFYFGMLAEPFRTGPARARLRRSALIFTSQAATALGYAAERRRPTPAGALTAPTPPRPDAGPPPPAA